MQVINAITSVAQGRARQGRAGEVTKKLLFLTYISIFTAIAGSFIFPLHMQQKQLLVVKKKIKGLQMRRLPVQ